MGFASMYDRNAKAYLRIESNGHVHEMEGRVDDFEQEMYRDKIDSYMGGGVLHSLPGPTRMKTKIEWGYGAEYTHSKIPKPVPTDMPDLGEFFD